MNQEKQIELLDVALSLATEQEVPLQSDEQRIPVADYTDEVRFELEKERFFARSYNVVTLSSTVGSQGAFITADVLGTPVIVVRGDDGKLRAFINVCRHRGATVEKRPSGHCKRFVCPYHAWTYNTDGTLHRVRHAQGFPDLELTTHGLVELPCTEAAGLVFVCPTPGIEPQSLPQPLAAELQSMLGRSPVAHASTMRNWNANWKIIVEGGMESYHFMVAHRDTIAPAFTDTLSTWERVGPHFRSILPKRSLLDLADLPRDQWRLRDHTHILYTLCPNAMILIQQSHFDLILLRPISVNSTSIEVITASDVPVEGEFSAAAKEYFARNHAFSLKTLDEDFDIGEQIQRGLETPANTHFRFARFEGALSEWRRDLDDHLN